MTARKKTTRPKKDPLTRSIESRERAIDRMEANIRKVQRDADQEIAAIRKRIKEKRVLLDALKRGAIEP